MIPYLDSHKLTICATADVLPKRQLEVRTRNAVFYALRHTPRVAIVRISPRDTSPRLIVCRIDDPIVTPGAWVATLGLPMPDHAWPAVLADVRDAMGGAA